MKKQTIIRFYVLLVLSILISCSGESKRNTDKVSVKKTSKKAVRKPEPKRIVVPYIHLTKLPSKNGIDFNDADEEDNYKLSWVSRRSGRKEFPKIHQLRFSYDTVFGYVNLHFSYRRDFTNRKIGMKDLLKVFEQVINETADNQITKEVFEEYGQLGYYYHFSGDLSFEKENPDSVTYNVGSAINLHSGSSMIDYQTYVLPRALVSKFINHYWDDFTLFDKRFLRHIEFH